MKSPKGTVSYQCVNSSFKNCLRSDKRRYKPLTPILSVKPVLGGVMDENRTAKVKTEYSFWECKYIDSSSSLKHRRAKVNLRDVKPAIIAIGTK